MAGEIIRPSALPNRANPVASEKVPVDNGATVGGATIESLVNAGRPLASQAEALAGVQATKAMTPLTTKQAIDAHAVTAITAGSNTTIDSSDPNNPVISYDGSAVTDGDKGDMLVSSSGASWSFSSAGKGKLVGFAADRAALALFEGDSFRSVALTESGREGQFLWDAADQSANVTLDTMEGIYIAPAADPTGASGAWVRKVADGHILASWFGTVGDDTADDTESWQVAALFAAGRTLCGENGKTYNMTAELELPDGCTLALRKSRMNFRVTGAVRNVVPGNNCKVLNGTIKNFGTSASGSGDHQCPLSIGKFREGVDGDFVGVENVQCLNLTIESDWDQGNGIMITGDSHNVVIENIVFPDSPMYCPILAHWGGTVDGGTGHPHNIEIRNIKCGDISASGYLISLSAAYNVEIDNVTGGTCYMGFHNYGGDYTNMFAPAEVKPLVGKNCNVRNMTATDVRKAGIFIDGQSYDPDIVPDGPTILALAMDGIVEGCRFLGAGGISGSPEPTADYGAWLANCNGVSLRNNYLGWFNYGIIPTGPTSDIEIRGNAIRDCRNNGIAINHSSVPLDWSVQDNNLRGNNRGGAVSDSGAAILIGTSRNARVRGNRVGNESGGFDRFGVRVTSTAQSPAINDNWVQALASGGTAYSIASSTNYDINASGRNNRAANGLTPWGGTTLLNSTGGVREGIAIEGGAPSAGTWNAGDRLYSKTPSATVIGYVCTAAGSPGTWRAFGT